METASQPATPEQPPFRVWRLVLGVLTLLLLISLASQWYARSVTMPRYCGYPEDSIDYLERVLTQPRPAGDEPRRPYIIAARLMFLVPREGDEPLQAYLDRVRAHLREQCP